VKNKCWEQTKKLEDLVEAAKAGFAYLKEDSVGYLYWAMWETLSEIADREKYHKNKTKNVKKAIENLRKEIGELTDSNDFIFLTANPRNLRNLRKKEKE
jgi:hypothetical protein